MERLTKRVDGIAVLESWAIDKDPVSIIQMLCNRLAAYEDTGLKPEEIADFMKRWEQTVEIGGMLKKYCIDHIRDLLHAEQAGRLVVLPCKVGDTVYMPVGKWGTITGYEADECDGFHIARDGVLQIKAKCYSGNHGTYGVPGKTVFLTREEAEAALIGGEGL